MTVAWGSVTRMTDLIHPGADAGALAGGRYQHLTGVAAYRSGLQLIRDAVGPEGYLVGCGAPIQPSVGLVDAMWVSPDTFDPTQGADEPAQAAWTGLRGRVCADGPAWWPAHGCTVVSGSTTPTAWWPAVVRCPPGVAEVIDRYGGLRSASDRVADLDDWGVETTRRLLATAPPRTLFDATWKR